MRPPSRASLPPPPPPRGKLTSMTVIVMCSLAQMLQPWQPKTQPYRPALGFAGAATPGVQAGPMQTSPPGSPRMAASPMLHAVCGRQAELRMVRSPTQRRPSAQPAGQHTFRPFKMLSSPSKRAGLQQLNAQVAQAAQADRLAERQRGLHHDFRTATQEAPAPRQGAGEHSAFVAMCCVLLCIWWPLCGPGPGALA